MDIVDSQVHLNRVGIEAGIVAMNALGIQSAVVDEYDGPDEEGWHRPYDLLDNGVKRPVAPIARAAAEKYPTRLSYVLRLEHLDPELETVVADVKSSPGGRGLRICVNTPEKIDAFVHGEFDNVFAAAATYDLPLFVLLPACSHLLQPYAERFPSTKMVVDHCGVLRNPEDIEQQLLPLGRFSNVALKWSHAHYSFPSPGHPFREIGPYLRRAADAFGAERIMWGSDFTAIRTGCSWAETLFQVRDCSEISDDEKTWILGRAARRLLDWPSAIEAPGQVSA